MDPNCPEAYFNPFSVCISRPFSLRGKASGESDAGRKKKFKMTERSTMDGDGKMYGKRRGGELHGLAGRGFMPLLSPAGG